MTKPAEPSVVDRLLPLLCDATRATLHRFRAERPGEQVYAFAYVCPPEGTGVGCAIATEQGLTAVAQKYQRKGYRAGEGDPIPLLREWLRWANPDEGWYYEDLDDGGRFLEELLVALESGALRGHPQWTPRLCVQALRHLDAEGAFGTGADRHHLVVGVTFGSNPKDFARFAREANPDDVWARLHAQMRRGHELAAQVVRPQRP
jgi:hypothetical protein